MSRTAAARRDRELSLTHQYRFEGFTGRCHVTVPVVEGGPPVVFLVGAFQGPRSLRAAAERLGASSVTVTVETPGSVGDEVLPADHGFDWLSAAVVGVLDEMGLDRVDIVAASYATPLAMALAGLHPDRVNRLVLSGATAGFEGETGRRVARTVDLWRAGTVDDFADLVCDLVMNLDPDLEIVRRRQVHGLLQRQMHRLSELEAARYCENTHRVLDAPRRLAGVGPVTAPVLLFTGQYDTLTPAASCRRLLAGLPNGVLTLIRNTDHLVFLEDPDTAVELVASFLSDTLDGPLPTTTELEFPPSTRHRPPTR